MVNTYLAILALRPDHPDGAGGAGRALRGAGALGRSRPDPHPAGRGGRPTRRRGWRCTSGSPRCGPRSSASTRTRSPAWRRSSRSIPPTWRRAAQPQGHLRPQPVVARAPRCHPARGAAARRRPRRRATLVEMARLAAERLSDLRQAIGLWNQRAGDRAARPRRAGRRWRLFTSASGAGRRWPRSWTARRRMRRCETPAELALLERRGVLLHEKLGASQAALEVFRRSPGAAAAERARDAGAARDLRPVGRLRRARVALRRPGAFDDLCEVS